MSTFADINGIERISTPGPSQLSATSSMDFHSLIEYLRSAREMSPDDMPWPFRLIIMLLGYASIAVPAAALVYYVKKKHERGAFSGNTMFGRFMKSFAIGKDNYTLLEDAVSGDHKRKEEPSNKFTQDCFAFLFCFAGIQSTLVLMGFLQERIITQRYPSLEDPNTLDRFKDVQFLVFCNRIIALILASLVITCGSKRQPPHVPPYYVHSYTSFSNTISSWCQYEALKFVSFPTQTICKVSKVVATMLMGRVVRGQRYSLAEYFCGTGIAVGTGIFLLNTGSHSDVISSTSMSGIVLMIGYLIFDSFTLNWQKVIFDTKPQVSKYQMMLGVNIFSAILCFVSLLEQGTLFSSIHFALTHENFMFDNIIFSLSGATGQLFIYATIERFGPILFAVIMTVRQMLSIMLSSVYYGHPMTVWAVFGLLISFSSIFADIYRRYFNRKQRSTANLS